MNSFFTVILIGISLSMDAFSFALIYGVLEISRKDKIILSLIVGLFHFFMPLLGLMLGNILGLNLRLLASIIFILIGIEMIISIGREEKIDLVNNMVSYLLFGFSVSIDSFTTGIGLKIICNSYLLVAIIFMLCSSFFTYLGLKLGNILSIKFGNVSTLIGGLVLIVLGIIYLF